MSNIIDFDFHLHCLPGSGDSKQTVLEAVKTAKDNGIATISITDHNSIESYKYFQEASLKEQINIICGIECSVIIQDEIPSLNNVVIHILGLGITQDKAIFESICSEPIKRIKKWDCELIKFCESFFKVKLKSKNKYGLRDELISLGYFADKKEFRIFVQEHQNEIGTLIPFKLSEICEIIHKLGGIVILAHPNRGENHRRINQNEIEMIVGFLVKHGLDGIELFHPDVLASSSDFSFINDIAKKYNLLLSVGSDRHGASYNRDNYFSFNENEYKTFDFNKIKQEILRRVEKK